MGMSITLIWEEESVHSAGITGNLNCMLDDACLSPVLFAEGAGSLVAFQLIAPLQKALTDMLARQDDYEVLNLTNGWGTAEALFKELVDLFFACRKYPEAEVEIAF